MRRCALLLLVAGCGGATPGAEEPDGEACEVARLDAQRAWEAVAREGRALTPPEAGPPIALEGVIAQLREHEAALRASPEEVDGQVAFALADAMMGGVDAVAADVSPSLRARADDAAEALLTDRSAAGAARATADAIAVLELVVQEARPERAAARTTTWSTGELVTRAADAAAAYGEGPREGDRAAEQAEDLPPIEGLTETREAAAAASAQARAACGFRRALTVPSPN